MLRLTVAFCFLVAANFCANETPSIVENRPPVLRLAQQEKPPSTTDCAAETTNLPAGATRVYIALRNGADGSGKSMDDARDGSTVSAFDRILRCYSEGCTDPPDPQKAVARTENLIVCLGPGTFSTLGNYDYLVSVPHPNPAGFTVGKGWKIHGAGQDKTTIQLSDYLASTEQRNPRHFPVGTAIGLVIGTNSDNASGVEISDLTIDANYPALKSRARQNGIRALTLEAIHLRSDRGGHWIHNVNIINAAGEIGGINIQWEAFPVWIVSADRSAPGESKGNIIEHVHMSRSSGETGSAITMANALGEIRNNVVEGYPIGYGGWDLGETVFHDNTAIATVYGFNIDSLVNRGVRIERNKIIHPRKYGMVIGGGGTYANFKILNNEVTIDSNGVTGLIFQGNVTNSVVSGNKILAENSSGARATAIRSFPSGKVAGPNHDNVFQSNQIAAGMSVKFQGRSESQSCFSDNRDESGNPRQDLRDNHGGPCISGDALKP